jgi:hypothetical protein
MPVSDRFEPPRILRNGHIQSLLASLKLRSPWIRRRARALVDAEQFVILDCGGGVRLTGLYSQGNHDGPLAVLIHGWEGSARSQYMLSTAAHLFERGYRVFRFQLRDHGDSHHLNDELFHSCRLDEAVHGVREIQRRFGRGQPLALSGYSLGGNFALRIGVRAPAAGIDLTAIAAICPVADPAKTLRAMETSSPVYERYFMRKWRRSLRRKADLFPGAYSDEQFFTIKSMRGLTAHLVEHYGYMRIEDYFDGYRITGDRLATLNVPSLILTSRDDPIIPPDDFEDVAQPDCLRIVRTRYGGHCGYIDSFIQPTYADEAIHTWFENALRPVA